MINVARCFVLNFMAVALVRAAPASVWIVERADSEPAASSDGGGGTKSHIIIPLVVLPVMAVLAVAACSLWLWRRAVRDKARRKAARAAGAGSGGASSESRRPLRRAPRPLSGGSSVIEVKLPRAPARTHTRGSSRVLADDEALARDLAEAFGDAAAPKPPPSRKKAPAAQ